jgi:hypothetical protein
MLATTCSFKSLRKPRGSELRVFLGIREFSPIAAGRFRDDGLAADELAGEEAWSGEACWTEDIFVWASH